MAKKFGGLGKNLNALMKDSKTAAIIHADSEIPTASAATEIVDGSLKKLPIEWIERGKYQPRRDMNPQALEELAESIKAQGIMQPIVVRPIGTQRYEIIAGERRWRATQLAGLATIPALIREVPDEAAIAMALIENIQRENLNPVEEAVAFQRLRDEFGLTQQEVADSVGKSRAAVANLLRLLTLRDDVKTLLEHGDLEMGHARAILALDNEQQAIAAQQVVSKGMSVRQTEALVRSMLAGSNTSDTATANADIMRLEESLSEKVGVPVTIQHGAKGKGKLVLKYNSLDELDGILAHIK
ncbi:putative chromosome-partitioning protein ParB [Sinobacterium norvegicum]|uniref:Probable chromosome-partitioning protein ParB n=1 Tax=Sinobacterium norvegicum TaxID=1641715 RepID=A0ABN8EKW9_9GAMM|nr:ParB/RepB/Spo0J family partition protein [Sinobacterium norvegicum]CAH0993029.1 putative chromosome-partitioning protein ParB [Sinobacterium norvegicum]